MTRYSVAMAASLPTYMSLNRSKRLLDPLMFPTQVWCGGLVLWCGIYVHVNGTYKQCPLVPVAER